MNVDQAMWGKRSPLSEMKADRTNENIDGCEPRKTD